MDTMVLLNPGPVNLTSRVRAALAGPDLCHREDEYFDIQDEVRRRLLEIYDLDPAQWAAVVLSGSGTAAVESMICSIVPPDGGVAVIENGVYGERMSQMAGAYGFDTQPVTHDWGVPVDLDQLESTLGGHDSVTHVACVHHETTTGRLNDLASIGAICRARGRGLLVDAVSSFGAEHMDFEGWGITACAAVSNKCLHGAPGVAIVIVRRDALVGDASQRRSVYLDLATYYRAQDQRGTPFTPAVPAMLALREALRELAEQGGQSARHQRYRDLATRIEHGLVGLGLAPLLGTGESSLALRAWRLPENLSYDTLHDRLKRDGFIIYHGQGGLADRIFRIANMGAVSDNDVDRLIGAMGSILANPSP